MNHMSTMASILVVLVILTLLSPAFSKPTDEERVKKHKDLSDQKHYDDEHHNADYDHEAFLGDEYKAFDDLSPDESRRRLGLIYDKMDTDQDGFVSQDELQSWIQHVQNKYIEEDTERQWSDHETEGDVMTWERYMDRTYGFMNEDTDTAVEDGESNYSYKDMLERDRRRWKRADVNFDGSLDKKEFQAFLHPEDVEHMRDIVIDETIEDIDKDKDGLISLNEYIADFYDDDDEDAAESDWVKEEREEFRRSMDSNGDDVLDRAEVANWILPDDRNYVADEAKHLLTSADADQDNKLTKEEVLEKYDLFVGSQATDFGEALSRHDEF